jgi:ribonucleoside-diphosphate reductase alpha chain
MGILRVDHPDLLEFIECKLDGGIINFNISVAATDTFMEALAADGEYDLINPRTGQVTGRLRARDVFARIVRAAWRTGDPGMGFIDRISGPGESTPDLGDQGTNPCIVADALVSTVAASCGWSGSRPASARRSRGEGGPRSSHRG